jgi:N-acetylneuraminate synthase
VIHIDKTAIGHAHAVYIIAEIGINHNGDLDLAKKLIDAAVHAGCDAVKFQKRTPHLCIPAGQQDNVRQTPWGEMSYLDYRNQIEFGIDEYSELDSYCKLKGITWFASCWDEESVKFIQQFSPPAFKIASASLTDDSLIKKIVSTNCTVVLSTGMSTMEQIYHAVELCDTKKLAILHCTSTYPCAPEEINLKTINTLQEQFDCPVGYSGHEIGIQISLAAVARGARLIERHITLDRTMWGTDQAASLEPSGLSRLVRDIRVIDVALGDGVKKVFPSELPVMEKLRRVF